jgi:hypothetical protein
MRKLAILCCLSLVSVFSLPAFAQDAKPLPTEIKRAVPDTHPYRIEFAVRELSEDGKVVNSRSYRTTVGDQSDSTSIRTGSRVPVRTNDKGEVSYLDIGINLDCNEVRETPEGLHISINAQLSTVATPNVPGESPTPVIRQNRWSTSTVLAIGKPTVVFSSENLESKGRMEIEVTATPMR